jgi:hypothetical protein
VRSTVFQWGTGHVADILEASETTVWDILLTCTGTQCSRGSLHPEVCYSSLMALLDKNLNPLPSTRAKL